MVTFTITDRYGNPTHTLLLGHVTAKTFNMAATQDPFVRGVVDQTRLSYEYWSVTHDGLWIKKTKQNREAKHVTVYRWSPHEKKANNKR